MIVLFGRVFLLELTTYFFVLALKRTTKIADGLPKPRRDAGKALAAEQNQNYR